DAGARRRGDELRDRGVPAAPSGAEQPAAIAYLDEPETQPEPPRDRPRDVHLEPSGQDDLAPVHRSDLKGGGGQAQRHGQLTGTLGRRRGGGSRRREPEHQHDGEGDDSHRELGRTTTGVPYVANSYRNGASYRLTRTQPWDAAYVGTIGYSWSAIPPVK